MSRPLRLTVLLLLALGAAGLVVFAIAAASGSAGTEGAIRLLYVGLYLVPAALCLMRAALVHEERALWVLFGLGMSLWAASSAGWGTASEIALVLAVVTLIAAFVRVALAFNEMRALAQGKERSRKQDVADGAQREEDGAQREAEGAQREKDGAKREKAGVIREADGAQRERDLEESILRDAGEGISRLDQDGKVTFANPAAARMTGHQNGELEGNYLHGRIHHTKPDGSAYSMEELKPDSPDDAVHPQDVDVYWRKDGTSFPVEYTSTPIVKDGQLEGAVIVFKDITDRRAAERAKDEFTAVVSHELRTPLTSIRGSLGLLESGVLGPLPEKGQRMVEIAVENTDRLVRLINDILDIERINSGYIDMHRTPCKASELVERAVEEMTPVGGAAQVTLEAVTGPGGIFADADRVHQALTNLIANAIKFSEPGSTVTVSAEHRENEVLFQVKDEGRGIPAANLETIFERFHQVDKTDSREKGGTGLGLSICRTILEHHGGRIWVESGLEHGSTFSFVLPVEATNMPTLSRPEGDQFFTVLIVEDDLDLAEILAVTLRRHGIETVTAATGLEAIELSQHVNPDLLALDVRLPEADGYEVVEWLRRHERLNELPVVVYTALELDADNRERPRLGDTTEFLTKGRVTPEDFEERVMQLLGRVPQVSREVPDESEAHPVG